MTPDQFNMLAIRSAERYYDFLDANNRGLSEIVPTRIEHRSEEYKLFFHRRLPMMDSIYFRIYGTDYTQEDLGSCAYDDDNKYISIIPDLKFRDLFNELRPEHIVAVSDLKFLVKRVCDWYTRYNVTPPDQLPTPKPLSLADFYISPSEEQLQAVQTILQNPFSYVWGIPGSGKTRVVLSLVVLSYVKSKKKVLICAPTNNALEQSLRAVIPALEAAGLSRDLVLRLGAPTQEFVSQYPSVCELFDIENARKKVEAQLLKLEQYEKYTAFCASYDAARKQLEDTLTRLESLQSEKTQISLRLDALYEAISSLSEKTNHVRIYQNSLAESIHTANIRLETLSRQRASFRFRLLHSANSKAAQDLDKEISSEIQRIGYRVLFDTP